MATLEKIRSKSVLLIIIIGVALLAFIVGDAITNSRNLFGDQTTVAKIGGKKIDYTDYVRKREELNSQLEMMRKQNPAQYSNFDAQVLSQQAIEALVNESLIDDAASKAGLRTSSSQLKYYVIDNPVNPAIRDIMTALANSGYGVSTPAQAYDVIFNPQNHGLTQRDVEGLQRQWIRMENETAQMVVRNTYQNLLMGTVKANNLDKQALYNDYVNTLNVDLAYVPFGRLDPEKYTADDVALQAEYANIKGRYQVDELTKDVALIAVNVVPSPADRQAATKLANETANAMRSPAGISKDLRKEGILVSQKELLAKDLPRGAVKDFVETAHADSVKIVTQSPKGFTIVKMGNKKSVVDSVKLNIVQVAGESLASKVSGRLNSGLSVDSLQNVFPADSVAAQSDQWIVLYNAQGWTGAIDHSQLDSLMNAGGKYINLLSTPGLVVLGQMVEKSSPKSLYEYQEVTYDLKPSSTTLSDEQNKLEEYLAANSTPKDFIENASKEGYRVQNLSLSSSSPAIPNGNSYYPESRQVVRWVMMDGKPGHVSHVYESSDALNPMLYAVAVVSEYDDYAPLSNNSVNNFVADRVRKAKAADELIAQYQPKATSMASAAQAMNVESRNDSTFRFGRNPRVRDAAVMGQIAGSQPGKVIVVKGDNGIYAYQVLGAGKEDFEYNDQQYARQYNQMIQPNFIEMLKGGNKLKNNVYKFEAGD